MGIIDEIVAQQSRLPSEAYQAAQDRYESDQQAGLRSIAAQLGVQAKQQDVIKSQQDIESGAMALEEARSSAPLRAQQKELAELKTKTDLLDFTHKLSGPQKALERAKTMQLVPEDAELTTVNVEGVDFDAVRVPGAEPFIIGESDRAAASRLQLEMAKLREQIKGKRTSKKTTIPKLSAYEDDAATAAVAELISQGRVPGIQSIDDADPDELARFTAKSLMLAREMAVDEGSEVVGESHIKRATELAATARSFTPKEKGFLDKLMSWEFGEEEERPAQSGRKWKEVE